MQDDPTNEPQEGWFGAIFGGVCLFGSVWLLFAYAPAIEAMLVGR